MIIILSTTCSSPDGLVEPVVVYDTYVDIVDGGRGFMFFDEGNVVFGVLDEVVDVS